MNPLIVVFLKWPEPGRVKTRLAETVGDQQAAAIYEALVREVGGVLSQCQNEDVAICYAPGDRGEEIRDWLCKDAFLDRPVHHWWAQPEVDLGGRQAWAVEEAFSKGYDEVALIGTDCIDVSPGLFAETWEALEKVDWVFGPAHDGGYYLGATKRGGTEVSEVFGNVRWSTEHTLTDCVKAIAERDGQVALLKVLKDVDNYDDWISLQDRVMIGR